MTTKLKNCPFCNSAKIQISDEHNGLNPFCADCGVMTGSIEEWNTRTPAIDKQKLIEWINEEMTSSVEKEFLIKNINNGEFDV